MMSATRADAGHMERLQNGLPADWTTYLATEPAAAQNPAGEPLHMTTRLAAYQADAVVLLGDRRETLAWATGATICRVPIVHLHGGELTNNAEEDAIRHAVSRLATIHCCATRASADRLLRWDEEPWRVHHTGAPGLVGLPEMVGATPPPKDKYGLVLLNPELGATESETRRMALAVTEGLPNILHWYAIAPNGDPNCHALLEVLSAAQGLEVCATMKREAFVTMLADAMVVVGNSSACCIEAPVWGRPVVLVGRRQGDREAGRMAVRVPAEAARIKDAIHVAHSMASLPSRGPGPYYRADACSRVAAAIIDMMDRPEAERVQKRFQPH